MTDILLRAELHTLEQAHKTLAEYVWPWAKDQIKQGNELVLEARLLDDAITEAQRGFLHGVVLTEISLYARPNGQQFPMPVWKEYFRSRLLPDKRVTTINPLTGKKSRQRKRISTEDLGVRAYSDLIDRVSAFAATELGVTFPASYDQWEREQIDMDTGEIMGGVQ